MAMVKAFAYGSGGAEIAGILQYHKVDYLGVAYADEGVELRKAGIHLPIMVMNPEENAFEASSKIISSRNYIHLTCLDSFDTFFQQEGLQQYPVHIEIETGMNRLGFSVDEMESCLALLCYQHLLLKSNSVFSSCGQRRSSDRIDFTLQQYGRFEKAAKQLQEKWDILFFGILLILQLPFVIRNCKWIW